MVVYQFRPTCIRKLSCFARSAAFTSIYFLNFPDSRVATKHDPCPKLLIDARPERSTDACSISGWNRAEGQRHWLVQVHHQVLAGWPGSWQAQPCGDESATDQVWPQPTHHDRSYSPARLRTGRSTHEGLFESLINLSGALEA